MKVAVKFNDASGEIEAYTVNSLYLDGHYFHELICSAEPWIKMQADIDSIL